MFHIPSTAKKAILAAGATSIALLAACGPNPNATLPGNTTNIKLNAVAVSEINPEGSASSSISLGWDGLGGDVKSIKIFRRLASQSDKDVKEISSAPFTNQTTLEDKDPSLQAGIDYVYALRADNANNIAIISAQSPAVGIVDAKEILTFKLLEPAKDDEILKDPLGKGHTFSWEDAGTGLYHVQVSDAAGVVRWGAITKDTSISYGTQSGTTKQSGISTPADPKLILPLALTKKLAISSVAPNAARNEVQFQGIAGTGNYRLQVSAIETKPNKGDLAGARSIGIRKATEIRFFAQ